MASVHDEVADALAAVRARQQIASIERSARVALRACGWSASRGELEAWVETLPAHRRAAVVEKALALQVQSASPEKRYTPEEIEAYMARTMIPKAKGDEIRAFVADLRAKDPDTRAADLLPTVNRKFGTKLSLASLYQTYWEPRFRAESKRQPGRAADPPPARGTATAPSVAPAAAPASNGGRPATTSAPGSTSPVDPVRLGPIQVITISRDELRVVIDYAGPVPTVYALVAAAAAVLAERTAA